MHPVLQYVLTYPPPPTLGQITDSCARILVITEGSRDKDGKPQESFLVMRRTLGYIYCYISATHIGNGLKFFGGHTAQAIQVLFTQSIGWANCR